MKTFVGQIGSRLPLQISVTSNLFLGLWVFVVALTPPFLLPAPLSTYISMQEGPGPDIRLTGISEITDDLGLESQGDFCLSSLGVSFHRKYHSESPFSFSVL